jgi:hypothetical protein
MYSIGEFEGTNFLKKQNWRKLIYEKPNACVGRYIDIGGKYLGECSGKNPYWTWS